MFLSQLFCAGQVHDESQTYCNKVKINFDFPHISWYTILGCVIFDDMKAISGKMNGRISGYLVP